MNARKKAILAQLGTRRNTVENRADAYAELRHASMIGIVDTADPRAIRQAAQRRSRTISRTAKRRPAQSLSDGSAAR